MVKKLKVFYKFVAIVCIIFFLISCSNKKLIEECNKLKGEDLSYCFIELGQKTKDPSICDSYKPRGIVDVTKDYCYSVIATLKQDEKICEKISKEFGYKDACVESVAKAKNDISICDKSSEDGKLSCYVAIAEKNKDLEICKSIERGS